MTQSTGAGRSRPSKPKTKRGAAVAQVKPSAAANTGRAMVNVFDGTRQPYAGKGRLLVTARDGNQTVQYRDFVTEPSAFITGLPLFNNFGDNYTFLASADGYNDTGFSPVKLASNVDQMVDLMLLPGSGNLNFARAKWNALDANRPALKTLLAQGAASDDEAANRYSQIQESNGGLVLGCLLNITTAMQQIHLPQGSPLDYVKQVIWDGDPASATHMAQDRFFGWADPALIAQVKLALAQNPPEFAAAPADLHPGATSSYKQIEFGEANVQLTFHENDRKVIGGVNCVMVEPDIDYFKDAASHLILEVLVNAFGSLTDPRQVYVLRWTAGRRAGIPEFDPLYTIEAA